MILFNHDKYGALLMEVDAAQFREKWLASSPTDRVVLDDKRPAVRTSDPLATEGSYMTLAWPAWDRLKKNFNALMVTGKIAPTRSKLCAACGTEMKVHRELTNVWTFRCPSCKTYAIAGKSLIGGQIVAGEEEKL